MPGKCYKDISPVHQYLVISTHSIQHLLQVLPHILLMPELHFKHPNPIQCLLLQLLCICCLPFSYSLAPGSLSGGIVQISYLLHAVLAYIKPGGKQRMQGF